MVPSPVLKSLKVNYDKTLTHFYVEDDWSNGSKYAEGLRQNGEL